MMAWDDSLPIPSGYGDTSIARRRSIEGSVETDREKAGRERQAIKNARKNLADEVKDALWGLDDTRHNFRLMRLGLIAALLASGGVVAGWVTAIGWWMALNAFGGGVGLRLAAFLLVLVVCTILTGIGVCSAVEHTHKKYGRFVTAKRRLANATAASADYELDLHEQQTLLDGGLQ